MTAYTALDKIDPAKGEAAPLFPLTFEGLEDIVEYNTSKSGLANSLISKVARPAGTHLCYITHYVPIPAATWYSVQSGKNSHIAMESGLTYSNHSCEPTVEFHVFSPDANGKYPSQTPYPLPEGQPAPKAGPYGVAGEVRVSRHRDLQPGDDLKWFYPSTEWTAVSPFDCLCGAPKNVCIGNAAGASTLPRSVLERYHLNAHIQDLLHEREGGITNGANGTHSSNGVSKANSVGH